MVASGLHQVADTVLHDDEMRTRTISGGSIHRKHGINQKPVIERTKETTE
ncbi:TPA: hypothetical protein LT061_004750 [Salmonella enterica subsp. enterica serovar Blitta]|nr:hypothetical protein [Salmonella enterica]HBM0098196.1 hypothetical protein [Salmonella enterica subsp. enterica serovar Blitta]